MYELEVNRIEEALDACPKQINMCLVADTGVGKTTVIEKYCKDRGIFLKTLILSQLEASETLGIPVRGQREFRGETYEVLKTAIPQWVFELAEHENAMLFLDELLCAQPSVMNAFLNMLSQKRVENIDLSHVRIVAATNVGNYTFDPDANMIARFCWFYVVNKSVNEYLKDKRIINNYKDENDRQGVLFEHRSLKPRCHEQLTHVDDEHLLMFYEGFTNRKYVLVHKDPDINDVIAPYFVPVDIRHFDLPEENLLPMVAVLTRTFNRIRKWDSIIASFINVDLKTLARIKGEINRITESNGN